MFNYIIAHISDIHIKNNVNINYCYLLDTLHKEKPDIIVLTGDIIDSINVISPSIILDITTFLISLTNICPVIMIPGNHDIDCKYQNNDFFTAILSNHSILTPPLFNYWRHSNYYTFMNILWTVIAPDEHIPDFEFNLMPQILLFHETLDRIPTNSFCLYNAVMAGHFHTRQIIGPNAAYSGSLFQQNIGESHIGHGIIIWNITDAKTIIKEIDIRNDNSFLKVEIDNNIDITPLPLPEKVLYYDIYYSNSKEFNDIIQFYEEKYSMKARNIKNKNKYIIQELNNININEFNNIEVHNELIKKYMENNNELLPEILELHKQNYLSNYSQHDFNNCKLKLVSLEFENMYNYIGYNVIHFCDMENKISGIIANNNTGKTALIDIIIYMLYDVHPRTNSKQFILNKHSEKYRALLTFELNSKIGIINKETNNCTFFFNGINLTRKTIPQTINEIKKIVGTFNDNIITSIQLQYNTSNFITVSASTRKQKLADILSLTIFENIESTIVKQISDYSSRYKLILNNIQDQDEDFNEERIELLKYQIKCVDNLDNDLLSDNVDNCNNETSNNELYEMLFNYQEKLKRIEIDKIILSNSIDNNVLESVDIIQLNNEIKNINELILSIENKINEFKDENIKKLVIDKYSFHGNSYLYKLCRAEQNNNETITLAANIANLLLEQDHNIKLKEILENKFNNYNINLQKNKKLKDIESEINYIKNEINNISKCINNKTQLYINLYEEYQKKVYKKLNEDKRKELDVIFNKLKVLKLYRQIIKPSTGIINIILLFIKKRIEQEVNIFLNQFNLMISIDNNYEILFKNCDDEFWLDISLTSGYQKFILNIIFRLVLWNISETVLLDALIIDEGFSVCDKFNTQFIIQLLQDITKKSNMPKLLFIISHTDIIINSIEYPLYIKNNKIIQSTSLNNNKKFNIVYEKNKVTEKNNSFYCDICDKIYKTINKDKHLNSLSHKRLINKEHIC